MMIDRIRESLDAWKATAIDRANVFGQEAKAIEASLEEAKFFRPICVEQDVIGESFDVIQLSYRKLNRKFRIFIVALDEPKDGDRQVVFSQPWESASLNLRVQAEALIPKLIDEIEREIRDVIRLVQSREKAE